jgi:hypothetical protein
MNSKDPSIDTLLRTLSLEDRGWMVVDNWDADLFAIGIARRGHPRRLVYISTFKQGSGRYYYECEVPTGLDDGNYLTTSSAEGVDLDTLIRAMKQHLSDEIA